MRLNSIFEKNLLFPKIEQNIKLYYLLKSDKLFEMDKRLKGCFGQTIKDLKK